MNRSQTVSKAVACLARWTGRDEDELETIARELLDADELPKSIGRDYAKINVAQFGLLTLATLCVNRPTRKHMMSTLDEFKKLRLLSPQKAKPEEVSETVNQLTERNLLLSTEELPNITSLPALFKVDYFQRPDTDFYKRVEKATITIDRAHPSAVLDWGDGEKAAKGLRKMSTASVFGRLKHPSYTDGLMVLGASWPLKYFLQAQMGFFTEQPARWKGEEKQA